MNALVWFRGDLRTSDNRALHAAATSGRPVVGLFLIAEQQWREHDWGDPKIDFVLRCAAALGDELERLGIPLLVRRCERFADAPRVISDIVNRHRCSAVYWNREYEVNEQARDEQVDEAVRAAGATVQSLDDQTIVPPDGLRTGSGGYYTVFTPYRRRWTEVVKASWPIRLLDKPKRQQRLSVGREPVETITFHTSRYWPAGEREAERRLSKFIEQRIGAYDKQRDYPAVDGTSTLSPYLAAGCISARQCLVAAARANGGEIEGPGGGATTWISELIWREFYRHVMVGFRRVSMNRPFKLATERLKWSDDEARFEAWREGRTGVPIVDAAMRQLHATGWMHNRLRMITAMYLTKDLRIDWRRGERHFMQHLVDGDLASNNGGWQWSASTGTDSVPYFRIFNPYTQGERFDANGEFVRRWLPELKDVEDDLIHDPTAWPLGMHERTGYPRPIVDHAAARLEALAMFKAIEG